MTRIATHYDANDDHALVDDEPVVPSDFKDDEMDKWAALEHGCQLVTVKGVQYQVVAVSDPDENGDRAAKLIQWQPF